MVSLSDANATRTVLDALINKRTDALTCSAELFHRFVYFVVNYWWIANKTVFHFFVTATCTKYFTSISTPRTTKLLIVLYYSTHPVANNVLIVDRWRVIARSAPPVGRVGFAVATNNNKEIKVHIHTMKHKILTLVTTIIIKWFLLWQQKKNDKNDNWRWCEVRLERKNNGACVEI